MLAAHMKINMLASCKPEQKIQQLPKTMLRKTNSITATSHEKKTFIKTASFNQPKSTTTGPAFQQQQQQQQVASRPHLLSKGMLFAGESGVQ